MKKIFFALLLLPFLSVAQGPPSGKYSPVSGGFNWERGYFRALNIPVGCGAPALKPNQWNGSGAVYLDSCSSLLYYYSLGSWRLITDTTDLPVGNFLSHRTRYIADMGQSNAYGSSYTCCSATSDTASNPKVMGWDSTVNRWVVLHVGQKPLATMAGDGLISPSVYFYYAKWLSNLTGDTVKVVTVSLGGMDIAQWHNGVTPQFMLTSFDRLTRNAGVPYYDALIWIQGEADNSTNRWLYRDRWDSVKAYLRRQSYFPAETPIGVVGMPRVAQGANPVGTSGIEGTLRGFDFNSDPYDGYVTTDSATLAGAGPFFIHYNENGLKRLGYVDLPATLKSLPGNASYKPLFKTRARDADVEQVNIYNLPGTRLGIDDTIPGYPLTVYGNAGLSKDSTWWFINNVPLAGGKTSLSNFTLAGASRLAGTGHDNYSIGVGALGANTTASSSIAIGSNALHLNTTGDGNIAIGNSALAANTTSGGSIAIGNQAMGSSAGADFNTAVGGFALQNSAGSSNTAMGYFSLNSTTSVSNTAFGFAAGQNVTNGNFNAFFGVNAGLGITSGVQNTFIGPQTVGNGVTTGGANTVIGGLFGGFPSNMFQNTVIGDGNGHIHWRNFNNDSLLVTGINRKTPTPVFKMNVYDTVDHTMWYTDLPTAVTSLPLSSITAMTTSTTINNADNPLQWQWNTLSSNTGFLLNSTSTAASSSTQVLFKANLTGANANAGEITTTADIRNTHTGAGTNIALKLISTSGSTNYSIDATGQARFNTGINLNSSSSDLQLNGSAGTTGQVLTSAGSGNTPTWTNIAMPDTGQWVPTLTNTTNVAASTPYVFHFMKIGNDYNFWGEVDIDPTTTATLTVLKISMPVSTVFINTFDLAGTAADDLNTVARVRADIAGGVMELRMTPTDVTNRRFSVHGSYRYLAP